MELIEMSVPAEQVPAQWPEILERIRHGKKVIAITENDEPTAVLLSYDLFAGLLETMEILADNDTVRQLVRAAEDEKHGRFLSMEEVFG